jgi:hypothetical protein
MPCSPSARQGHLHANIASVDLRTGTLVLTRNNPSLIVAPWNHGRASRKASRWGLAERPAQITELPLEAGLWVIIYTDGLPCWIGGAQP